MRKLILIAHTSLDGFVAGINGELDGFPQGLENLDFVSEISEQGDAVLFGRISFQLLDSYWPTARDEKGATPEAIRYSNWYNTAQKIVISRSLFHNELLNTIIIKENIIEEVERLKLLPGKAIIIFGSPAISQILMRNNLIDTYWIFVNPVIFGKGIPLFSQQENNINLQLSGTQQFPNGEIALKYERPVS